MAQNFLTCDRDQDLLLPPSLKDWLPDDHLAWFVLDAVDELDLSDFYASYREDGWGAAAHDPKMMVALFIYAYSIGVRSARAIECRCHDDVAFRVICAGQTPDHATIARFRVRHERAIAELFGGVLELCASSGLVKVGVVAVDGTKIAASATHHSNRSYQQIAEEILKEAAEIDAAGDELYGEARGDELPEGFRTSGERRQRFREAKKRLEEERRVAKEHEDWRARGIAKDGSRRMTGHNPEAEAAARGADRQDQRDRSRLAQPEDDAWLRAGLQRPGRRHRRPGDHRRRHLDRVA
jgi:transposase